MIYASSDVNWLVLTALHKFGVRNFTSPTFLKPILADRYYSCETILRCSWFFLQFKEFELYWGAVFFTTRRGVLEKSFFINFWSEFWSGKWNAWKNLEWFWRWTKVKSRAKRVVFVHTAVFERARNWCAVKKGWLWFCFNFRLVSVVVWRFLEIYVNFMIIRRLLMIFGLIFCVFLTIILFYWIQWVLKKPLLLEQFYDNNWLQFWVRIIFFVEKYDKKWRKLELFFLIFSLLFSGFFCFSRQVS